MDLIGRGILRNVEHENDMKQEKEKGNFKPWSIRSRMGKENFEKGYSCIRVFKKEKEREEGKKERARGRERDRETSRQTD
jgi:hypothetical protein